MNNDFVALAVVAISGLVYPDLGMAQDTGAVADQGVVESSELASPAPEASADVVQSISVDQPQAVVPEPEAPQEGSSGGIEEVVVTARRTAENLQDVPVAISALSADDLAREQINNAQDLQGRVPSMVISPAGQQRNTETPTIRGQGATYGSSPGVVIYFAEVPLPSDQIGNGQGGPGKFFDLQNLQVLKGSQGTLFGRNTTGGALLLEPHRPEEEFSASLKAEGSNYSGRGLEAMVNTPLGGDTLLLRIGGKVYQRDGFTHDVVTGKDYDSKNFWTGRVGLTWRPTDAIENYLLGYYTHNHDHGTSNVVEGINSAGFNEGILGAFGVPPLPGVPPELQPGCQFFNLMAPSTNCGQDIVAEQRARDYRHVQLGANPNDILKTGAVIDTFKFELNDSLTVRNIASYSFYQHHYRWDFDGSRAALDDFVADNKSNSSDIGVYTEELQLQGNAFDDRLKFVTGLYAEYLKPEGLQEQVARVVFQDTVSEFRVKRFSYGPYAQGSYNLGGLVESLEDLTLTAGVRYSFDDTKGFSSLGGDHGDEVKDSAPTFTVGLDYKLDATLLYGKVSRGYKSGGFSGTAVNPENFTFDPEYVTNFELGQKSDFEIGSMAARLNSAVYYTDYKGLQKTYGDSYLPENAPPGTLPTYGGATYNVGRASIAGFETDATLQPMSGLTLIASYSYTHAQYDKFDLLIGTINPQVDCSGQSVSRGNTAELKCIPYQFAPKNQFSFSGRYEIPIDASYGDLEGSLTYVWVDRQYASPVSRPDQEPGAWLASYGLLNGSLRWGRIFGTALDLQLFGSNLTGEKYRIANSNVWTVLYAQSSIYGEPRTVGLSLAYSWGL